MNAVIPSRPSARRIITAAVSTWLAACSSSSAGPATAGSGADGGPDALGTQDAAGSASEAAPDAPSGPLQAPTLNPSAPISANDFLLSIAGPSGASFCYTLDGSTPSCVAGACAGSSQAYDAARRVAIDGTVTQSTGPSQGQVTVTAIACEAGLADSPAVTETFTLEAAPPSAHGLVVGANPFSAAGIAPTFQTATVASINPSNVPTIRYTIDGAAPTCQSGSSAAVGDPIVGLTQSAHELRGITCKSGFKDSTVEDDSFTFQLTAPVVTGGILFARSMLASGTSAAPGIVVDSANAGSGDTLCVDLTGATPSCNPDGSCNTVAPSMTLALSGGYRPGNQRSPTTTVKVAACAPPGLLSSAASTASFTLQYAPPFLSAKSASPPATQSGWDWQGTGAPATSLQVPAGATQPYGPLTVWQVLSQPCTQGDTSASAGTCTGSAYFTPDFFCWAKNATAACPASGTTCATAAGGNVALGGTIGGASAGDSFSVIACQAPAAAIVWGSSAPTTVAFTN